MDIFSIVAALGLLSLISGVALVNLAVTPLSGVHLFSFAKTRSEL
jgi:hypothetical protein